ncbi:alpha/beta hydrolase [Aurantiacibacter aquimixticola]|uniref:Alpha/beta fold hydrolase n=1 Tax=Aurantiacibacter aquimixticola TaxID=1958945 RepID=A0A419RW65_9SPHN|nr:alpha/beta fold hydrolase [Aurantiacibacter aquimixticola]RJY10032.1 alpha/beta fold hydrolase [Aurantiacibacter aquimixticola]
MSQITRHILTLPGGRRVHYRRCGSGPALLMVHQSPRSSAEYAEVMARWAAHFTCIAPDTPGFGQSDPLPGEPEIDEFADALAEFLEALGVGRCAAYGFHSGGVIAVAALKRNPSLFSCLAVGGYAVWNEEEMALFGESYLPEWHPTPYGEHLAWLWNRILEQSWFFPWFDVRDEARLSIAHADPARVHRAIMEMLDAGNAYRAGYGAVLRAPRGLPGPRADVPPTLITAFEGDPLYPHLERLGQMPVNWSAHGVATPEEHEAESLAFLQGHAAPDPCLELAQDENEGWIAVGEELIHWRGKRGVDNLYLHAPAAELVDPSDAALAIDVPGHGLSNAVADIRQAVEFAAERLGASRIDWPRPPEGDPDRLYPNLTPDRFGNYLQRAWSAARAEAMFRPWYEANAANVIEINAEALMPAAIARRARARLRAGDAARRYHHLLHSIHGD